METKKQKTINEKELETIAFWREHAIFEKTVATPAGEAPKGSFSFYDGPPFATGVPHHGHLLAGTIKDAIPRYQTMKGNSVRRVWGWDCHGLPLENLVEKKLGLADKTQIEKYGIENFNEMARSMVLEYEEEWKKVVPRMGRFVDMEHPYKTMDPSYTESIWWSFKTLFSKGLIYEGYKVMHICPRCETTLAQSEVNMPGSYRDVTDISVTVKFPLRDESNTCLLAWTTTPWTLPGNTALAVNRDIVYVKVQVAEDGETVFYILAKSKVAEALSGRETKIVEEFTGDKLTGLFYEPPFSYFKDADMPHKENIYKVWHADFITEDAGTGIAHEAPAFGAEDYELARTENIPLIQHVTLAGTFTKEVADFAHMKVKKEGDTQSADIEIIKWLAHNGKLFSKKKILHSYPHCWRCDTPLLNYATSSWFMDVTSIKPELLKENSAIGWVPDHMRDGRFGKWLEGARDWAISRARYWGAPLPVWKCTDCNNIHVFGSVEELQTKLSARNTYSVMRHAECVFNVTGISDCAGHKDNHITEKGRQEVLEKKEELASHGYDLIITSPLLRTRETAELVRELLGLDTDKVIEDARLREFDFGVYDGVLFSTFSEQLRAQEKSFDLRAPGGESKNMVKERMMELLFECEETYSGKKILFITHGSPMWMLVTGAGHLSDTQSRAWKDEQKKKSNNKYFLQNAEIKDLNFIPFPHSGRGLDFHRPYIDRIVYPCGGSGCPGYMKRIPDVFDCWYESGSMPFAQLHYPFENKELFEHIFPADFIAEGLDQTRGWFYSLINLSVGLFGKSSFKQVIVNGLTMAADGLKMSKSKKNYTDPMVLVEKYGADAFRYSLLASPLMRGENVPFPDSLVEDVYKKIIMRLENVVSFYTMYKEESIAPSDESQAVIDVWIRSRLGELTHTVTAGMEAYELDTAARPIDGFIEDLSVWYLRRSRERIKGEHGEEERRLSIATLGYILHELSTVLAPFMPFIAERVYKECGGRQESVHLEHWREGLRVDELVLSAMQDVRKIVTAGLEARMNAGVKVRQPLSSVTVPKLALGEEYISLIQEELNVKEVYENGGLGVPAVLDTTITAALQEEGDIRELARAIKDMRKEAGLSAGEMASITVHTNASGREFLETIAAEVSKLCGLQNIVYTDIETGTRVEIAGNVYICAVLKV